MPQSINKYKLYLYLFFFIFLSSTFNFKFLESYRENFVLKSIKINGLSYNEKEIIEFELNNFLDTNIFKIRKDKILEKLNKFNFLENIYINKIIPSSININLSKTTIIGKTLRKGKNFYIGKNGKLIISTQLTDVNFVPTVFGDFEIQKYIDLQNILKDHLIDIDNIQEYYYFKNKRWDLKFSNGSVLKLPSNKVEDSINIYKSLLNNGDLMNSQIIDLRVNNQIILTN